MLKNIVFVFMFIFGLGALSLAQALDSTLPSQRAYLVHPLIDHNVVATFVEHGSSGNHDLKLLETVDPDYSTPPYTPVVVSSGIKFPSHDLVITATRLAAVLYAQEYPLTSVPQKMNVHFQLYDNIGINPNPILPAAEILPFNLITNPSYETLTVSAVDLEIDNQGYFHAAVSAQVYNPNTFQYTRRVYYFKRVSTGAWNRISVLYTSPAAYTASDNVGTGIRMALLPSVNRVLVYFTEIVNSVGYVKLLNYDNSPTLPTPIILDSSITPSPLWAGRRTVLVYDRFPSLDMDIDSAGLSVIAAKATLGNNNNPVAGMKLFSYASPATTIPASFASSSAANAPWAHALRKLSSRFSLFTIRTDGIPGYTWQFGYDRGGKELWVEENANSTTGWTFLGAQIPNSTLSSTSFEYYNSPATSKEYNGRYYHGCILTTSPGTTAVSGKIILNYKTSSTVWHSPRFDWYTSVLGKDVSMLKVDIRPL